MAWESDTYSRLSTKRSRFAGEPKLVFLRAVAVVVLVLVTYCGTSAGQTSNQTDMTTDWGLSLAAQPTLASMSGFVRVKGHQFILNGKPLYVNGANLYWMMTVAANPSQRWIVSDMLAQAKSVGVTVVRAWAFADGGSYNPLQIRPGVYNEATFEGLDFAVSEAKKNGIRVILSFVNNYSDYGGKPQYCAWAQQYAGTFLGNDDDFYSNPTTRAWYKNHVKTVLTRVNKFTGVAYRNEPAVFAWELMNEPRCTSDTTGNTLQAWIWEMAAYVKSLDSIHLLEVGLEGFYSNLVSQGSSNSANPGYPASYASQLGTDFVRNNRVTGIDFATVHTYPDAWVPSMSEPQRNAWMINWVKAHINDSTNKLNKPVLFSEFGKSAWASGYSASQRFTAMNDMYNTVYESARSGGAGAGAIVWQLATTAIQANLNDGFQIVLGSSPSISNLIKVQSSRMASLGAY